MSINSGQVFLWENHNNDSTWYGVNGDHIVRIRQTGPGSFEFSSFPEDKTWHRRMFRLDDDVRTIFGEISRDSLVRRLVRSYPGLRVMRQDPQQCIFSFICASNTNITMIRRMLRNLTRKFGTQVKIDGMEIFTFPSAKDIDRTDLDELRSCGLGYRAKAIKAAAHAITSGQLDYEALKAANYEEAKKELLQIYGIGNKIADCILLFSLEKLDAFPIDVWIARALSHNYSWLHQRMITDKLTFHQYEELSKNARKYFGRYAGYAQQYLYYHMRQSAGKNW